MKIKNSELMQILEEVESDLAKAFESSRENLSKAAEPEMVLEGRKAKEHDGYHDSPENHGHVLEPEVHYKAEQSHSGSSVSKGQAMHMAEDSPSASSPSRSSPSASRSAAKAEGIGHEKLREGSHSSTMSKDSPDFEGSSPSTSSPSASSPSSASSASSPSAGSPDELHSELSAEAQPSDQPMVDDQHQYSPEELAAEYAQLPPDELEVHLQALLMAKEQQSGGAPDQGAPPPSPDQAQPPAPGPSPDMAMKTEDKLGAVEPTKEHMEHIDPATKGNKAMKTEDKLSATQPTKQHMEHIDPATKGNKAMKTEDHLNAVAPSKEHMQELDPAARGNKAVDMQYSPAMKSEGELDNLRKAVESQKEDIEILTKALKHTLEQPLRKAITSVAYLPRAEEPVTTPAKKEAPKSMADVTTRLTALTADKSLAKADRELINSWYERRVSLEKLAKFFE